MAKNATKAQARPAANSAARSGNVRSLERGLALLVAMNRRPLASVCELAHDTGLPRPTVYRLLDTLAKAGFVSLDTATDRYRPTHGVRALSDGFVDDEWVTEIAAPMMAKFTREHVWPVSLFTFEAGKMLVRDTTHRLSALSIDYGMVGKRMSMLRTAGGLVYLAFCPDNERKVILDLLAQSDEPDDQQARELHLLDGLFKSIRADGYATQDRVVNPEGREHFGADHCRPQGAWQHVADFHRFGADHERGREEAAAAATGHDDEARPRVAARSLQPGQTCGSHSDMSGNSVSSASNTRSATMKGVTPR